MRRHGEPHSPLSVQLPSLGIAQTWLSDGRVPSTLDGQQINKDCVARERMPKSEAPRLGDEKLGVDRGVQQP